MDAATRKEVLRLVPYGLYAVLTGTGDEVLGFTGSWLTQCSFDPPLLAVGVRNGSRGHALIESSGVLVLNFVRRDRQGLLQALFQACGVEDGRLADCELVPGGLGVPRLAEAVAWVECRVAGVLPTGDHTLFICDVVDVGRPVGEPPLLMADTPWHYAG
ncbi:MAG: flavin reductase [Armatimonadetes bacterium]|nr:flavin reductase [Armatimonadota bacterium]